MVIPLSQIEFNQNPGRICCPSMDLCEMAGLGIWILKFGGWDFIFALRLSARESLNF